MKVSVEMLPTSEAVLEVDLTWDELEKASDKAYRKLVQKIDVPGFRRGKAPRSLLERKLGKEEIYKEGLDEIIDEAYRAAVKEHELLPITKPEVEAPELAIGQPYHFSVKVPIISPVVLGDYASLHFEREEADVTSEEVEREIETLRNRMASWQIMERPAEFGDRVTVDLKLTIEDKTISDLKDNPFELTQERTGLFTGMDEQVVGMSAGESKEFTTTLPDNYTNEKLAGKEASYAVTLHKVETKEVPELDDAFASKISDQQYETLEDLRKYISDSIYERKKRQIQEDLQEKVINAVVEQSQVMVHPLLAQEEAEEMLHRLSHLLEQQQMSLDQYLLMARKTREDYLKQILPEAEEHVKQQFVLGEVATKEQITVTPEEIEAVFLDYEIQGQPLRRSEQQTRAIAANYRQKKAIERLIELTTDPEPDEEEESIVNAEAAALAGDAAEAKSEDEDVTAEPETETVKVEYENASTEAKAETPTVSETPSRSVE